MTVHHLFCENTNFVFITRTQIRIFNMIPQIGYILIKSVIEPYSGLYQFEIAPLNHPGHMYAI